jgi:succinate dehydrogenase / fumarate reductase cytochrome b subunit
VTWRTHPPGYRGPRPDAPDVQVTTTARPRGLYATDVGKKYVMAISGIVLMLFVLGHMVGNLKLYLGAESLNTYSEWLRDVGEPALPREVLLWIVRIVLLAAVFLHIDSAARLTRSNRQARPVRYEGQRAFAAADFASRTMRWTGVIVALFVIFHLLDLTWGSANPDFRSGDPYANIVASFERIPVAIFYVVANLALAVHLYHGAWSLFQSMGWAHPHYNHWRRWFAIGFAVVVAVGNISFPIAVVTGVVS